MTSFHFGFALCCVTLRYCFAPLLCWNGVPGAQCGNPNRFLPSYLELSSRLAFQSNVVILLLLCHYNELQKEWTRAEPVITLDSSNVGGRGA